MRPPEPLAPERLADDAGVILLNALAVVAVASAAVLLMISTQEFAVTRSSGVREAAQAQAYARGGELSAVSALRRDMVDAPATDHAREPWAEVADEDVEIRGGRFSLAISDAQDRFNLNSPLSGGLNARANLDAVVAAAGLPPQAAERIHLYVTTLGPVDDVADLAVLGLDARGLARLSDLVVVLPPEATLNVNTAGPEVLGAILRNPVAGRLLVARRNATGFLTSADFEGVGVIPPSGVGFTSDHYRVTTEVQVGDTRQRLVSLLRRRRVGGVPEVVVIRRQREAAALPRGTPPR